MKLLKYIIFLVLIIISCDSPTEPEDCAGVVGGDAVEDMCGVCDSDATNDCIQDCAEAWGGEAVLDECGVCDNDLENDCIQDCADVWGGDAEVLTYWYDNDGDGLGAAESEEFCNSVVEENWVLNNDDENDNCYSNEHDCAGVCEGNAYIENNLCYIDDIDGNSYSTIQIGEQLWMAENLKVTHYRNGDEIPNITNNGDWSSLYTSAYADYDNNPTNSEIYGRLYNWYTVDDSRGICPEGFHVPTDDEFKTLEMFLGMSESDVSSIGIRGTNEGSKLAGNADLWNNGDLVNNAEFATSGFTGLPGGHRTNNNGSYYYMGLGGYFWSSTESSSLSAWYRGLGHSNSEVFRVNFIEQLGLSVRCLKN